MKLVREARVSAIEVWHLEGKWDAIFCAHVTIVTSATRTVFLSLSHSSAGERVSG